MNNILIGSFPNTSDEWAMLTKVINIGIDSRLKAISFTTKDISDKCDIILGQKRIELSVDDTDSLVVLLYRIEELGTMESDMLFNDMCSVYFDFDEYFGGGYIELQDSDSVFPDIVIDGISYGSLDKFAKDRLVS